MLEQDIRLDDYTPYIFNTEDYGKTWNKLLTELHQRILQGACVQIRKKPGLLYAGTEYGMYICYDYGANWKPFQLNLPLFRLPISLSKKMILL